MPTKILVADDSATMRRVLEMTFAGEDATVLSVDGAEAALAKLADFAPDVVLADASMPGVDGYELSRRIKTNPQFAKVAVFVMGSQQAPYDDARGRAAGVDDHISKPFDTQSVIDRVAQALVRPRTQAAAGGGGEAARPMPPPPAVPARPAPPPAPAAAHAANGPSTGTSRLPQGGARVGMSGQAPMQATAKAAASPQPIPALRQGSPPLAPAPKPAAPAVARPAAAALQGASHDMSAKLAQLGLTREQIEGVLALSREVVEQVVWEVVPDLAEQLIKEELKRLTSE